MKQYLDLLKDVLEHGEDRDDRTGTGTRSVFGRQLRFDLREGFPLVTTKKMFTRGFIAELLWLLHGKSNIAELTDQRVHIWDAWANEQGDLGPVYPVQWRHCLGVDAYGNAVVIDQIKQAIEDIKNNSMSRRIIVDSWNVTQIKDMALPPCHMFFQFYVHTNDVLDMQLYVRSNDLFLGKLTAPAA